MECYQHRFTLHTCVVYLISSFVTLKKYKKSRFGKFRADKGVSYFHDFRSKTYTSILIIILQKMT